MDVKLKVNTQNSNNEFVKKISLDDFDFSNLKKTTNCEKHGDNVDALFNNKCVACYNEQKRIDENNKKQDIINHLITLSNIPKRYQNATYDNYLTKNEEMKAFKNKFINYQSNQDFVVFGNTGTGKTHLSIALLKNLITNYINNLEEIKEVKNLAYYAKYYNLADLKISSKQEYKQLINAKYLIIDEFGANDTDFKERVLFEIIDQRYDNLLNTIIITNLKPELMKERFSPQLYSRLKENVFTAQAVHEDYRIVK